jgi:ureidoacrylate peracid hydrolase
MTVPPNRPYDAWKARALLQVDPQRTALLAIDLQRDFCSPDGALAALGSDVSPSTAVAARIDRFVPRVRNTVGLVAFFQLVYEPAQMSEAQRERLLQDGKAILCQPGTAGCELVVTPDHSDQVFTKHRYSAFSNQQFCDVLSERSITTVAVTGVDTHICVEGTVRHGYDLGYRMVVLSDLVATRRSEIARHEHSLAVCERYFAITMESPDFLNLVTTGSPRAEFAIETRR